jgi:sporulation protein YlmC with PRC-barrel domain
MRTLAGAPVTTADGRDVGAVAGVVIDPATHHTTHVVVASRVLVGDELMIPVELVTSSSADAIQLDRTVEPEGCPVFDRDGYVDLDQRTRDHAACECSAAVYPYRAPASDRIAISAAPIRQVVDATVPADALPVERGTRVTALDGERIGRLLSILTDPESNQASHLLVRATGLRGVRWAIPVSWVEDMVGKRIRIGVSRGVVDQLPTYPTPGSGAPD